MENLTGHYEPNAPGATSLKDARPLWIEGRHVTADVYELAGAVRVTVFLGGSIVYDGRLPERIYMRSQINPWIAQYVTGYAATEAETRRANEEIAEKVWRTHYAIAFAEDSKICNSYSPVYRASQKLLLATIRTVYGMTELKAWRVYDVLSDSGESVAYCVAYVRSNPRSSAYTR